VFGHQATEWIQTASLICAGGHSGPPLRGGFVIV
jgi:hypothetical protein